VQKYSSGWLQAPERPHVHVAFGGPGCAADIAQPCCSWVETGLAVRECSDNARPPVQIPGRSKNTGRPSMGLKIENSRTTWQSCREDQADRCAPSVKQNANMLGCSGAHAAR
jgi:hypothetical protein